MGALRVFRVLYFLAYYVARHRDAVIREQLAKVFPSCTCGRADAIHKQFLKNFCDVLVESVEVACRWRRTT